MKIYQKLTSWKFMRPTGSHNLKREHSASDFLAIRASGNGESGVGSREPAPLPIQFGAATIVDCRRLRLRLGLGLGLGTAAAALMSSKCSATNAPQNSSHGPLSASPFASIGQCVVALVNILIIYMEYAAPRGWDWGRGRGRRGSGRGDKTFDNRRDRFAAAASSTCKHYNLIDKIYRMRN